MSNQTAPPRPLPAGDRAVLLEFDTARQVARAHRALLARPIPGVIELVPAARTILVRCEGAVAAVPEALAAVVRESVLSSPAEPDPAAAMRPVRQPRPRPKPHPVEIPVVYDGPDLEEVASAAGLSVLQVVERHAAARYVVAFCGFAPGFGYLDGLDPALRLPRRATPRTRVPAGSVAVADEFTGVYPAESPGGWHLLGRTDARLWDVRRDPPALLAPGTRVRFRPVDVGA